MKDKEKEEKILKTLNQKENNAKILTMTEKGLILGFIAVDILNSTLRILDIQLENKGMLDQMSIKFYMDTLIRSAASYGEVHGAITIETTDNKNNNFFKAMGFSIDETHAFAPMSLIVHYE